MSASCHRAALKQAAERQAASVSFPAIGAGVATGAGGDYLAGAETSVKEAVFVLFDRAAYEAFAAALDRAPSAG